MKIFNLKSGVKKIILALGPESAGNFSVFRNGKLYFSEDFGDLLEDTNFHKYKHKLSKFLKKNGIKPDIILTDLHPLYKTTLLGQALTKKYKAKHIQVQHHVAHVFSAIGDKMLQNKNYPPAGGLKTAIGIALDGTGYGLDGKIWGGEIFKLQTKNYKLQTDRIGHLENQALIGGDLAIQEPARMLISILSKFLDKKDVYSYVKKYYSKNEFGVLCTQLQKNFNCVETSSTGRILDAVSILLSFCGNKRNYKHEPVDFLEKNSTEPFSDLKTKIVYDKKEKLYILQTTPLFEYLIKNIRKDKKRLAATAQLYIAEGFYEIIKLQTKNQKLQTFLAGGLTNNKIISTYFESKSAYIHPVKSAEGGAKQFNGENKIVPVDDAGLSFGQIIYCELFTV